MKNDATESIDDSSQWDMLPVVLKLLVLARTNLPTLFSMRNVRKKDRNLVNQFLLKCSALDLLKLLPICADESDEVELRRLEFSRIKNYRVARLEILKLQRLARELDLQSKWQKFQTMEEGILALMIVPLKNLDCERLKLLAFGGDQVISSEFVETEKQRLVKIHGQVYFDSVVFRMKNFYSYLNKTSEKKNDNFLIVLVIMILRMSRDEDVRNLSINIFSCDQQNFGYHMLALLKHAETSKNQSLLEVLSWITEAKVCDILKRLENIKDPENDEEKKRAIVKMQRRWYRLLTVPGSLDQPVPLNPLSRALFSSITEIQNITNYTLMSCALLLGWERAWDLYMTIHAHFYFLDRVNRPHIQIYDDLAGYISGPCFINLRNMPINFYYIPFLTLYENQYDPSSGCNNIVCHFGDISADDELNHSDVDCPDLVYCFLDNLVHNNCVLQHSSFKSVIITNMSCNNLTIFSCFYDNVRFDQSSFLNSEFNYCRFKQCYFSSSVTFKTSTFSGRSDSKITVFYQCKFDCDIVNQMGNIRNARFINCEFPKNSQLPNEMISYNILDIDLNTIESLYNFFLQLKESKDNDMIVQHILFSDGLLPLVLRTYQISGITDVQDKLFREIAQSQETVFSTLSNFFTKHTDSVSSNNYLRDYELKCEKFGVIVVVSLVVSTLRES